MHFTSDDLGRAAYNARWTSRGYGPDEAPPVTQPIDYDIGEIIEAVETALHDGTVSDMLDRLEAVSRPVRRQYETLVAQAAAIIARAGK